MAQEIQLKIVNLHKVRLKRGDLLLLKVPRCYEAHYDEIVRQFKKLPMPRGVAWAVMPEELELSVVSAGERRWAIGKPSDEKQF